MKDVKPYEGPSWDLTAEYTSVKDPQIGIDLTNANEALAEMERLNPTLAETNSVEVAQSLYRLRTTAATLIANVSVFARCLLSVDGRHAAARELSGSLDSVKKRYAVLSEPLSQFLDRVDEEVIEVFLTPEDLSSSAFEIGHARARRHTNLSLTQEQLIQRLAQDGLHSWNQLYGQLSGTLSCPVDVQGQRADLGLAEASGYLLSGEDAQRRQAWQGINAGWQVHEESCASVINAISGWRLEMCAQRSHEKPVHFLDEALHMSRISRATLETLMSVTKASRALTQRAARLQARAYGKPAFGPWDLRAPAPALDASKGVPKIAYNDALERIAEAYGEVDPSMAEFVRMMENNGWVEGTVGPSKRPGAYCTGFRKSKTPRVYMTYSGGASNVITLAHELGHAYHSWVMRDLPDAQRSYGMSLAETASTFGETLVRDALLRQSSSSQERLNIMWAEMSALTGFMLNIPTRYEFETQVYTNRPARPFRPDELSSMMSEAWCEWYGDALAEPDPMFWASKLHFHMSQVPFYNFPYLFGYLFSLGVYERREHFGDSFFERYVALLRDTGRMTAEDLAQQHLEVDLTEASFWEGTVAKLATRVDAFESLLDEVGL